MNLKELYEGAEPKLPGAPKGVQIMTPQQFVAKSAEGEEPEPNEELDENLRKWFKEKWVRFGPDGKIRGACARGDDSEGKPKCLPQSKAHSLGKKGRASAAARKRREDPNPERSGKAINVNTKKKSNEGVAEGSGNWYVRVKGKVLRDKKFDAIPFPSQESARLKAMEIHDKKRIPLDMIKLTQSWMDGPETQGMAEGSGKNVVKSVKVGNFRHDLVDTGMGWQVRIYNGDELYDTGLSKNSEQKGLAALEDAVAYTEKQTRTKRQGVSEGEGKTQKYEMMMRNGQVKKFIAKDDADAKRIAAGHGAKSVIRLKGGVSAGKVSEQGVAEAELDEACWKGYHKEGNKKMFGKTYPNCVKNTNEEQELDEINRRGFLKGLGAAALGTAGMKAQADQEKDLGNGFKLVTIDIAGYTVKAVLDTQTKTYYTLNRKPDGNGAIIRNMAPYIFVRDGKINMASTVGPETAAAMKGAGLETMQEGVAEEQLDEKCWDTHKQVGMKSKGGKIVPNCVPKESVEESKHSCPHCGGPMFEAAMMNEKKDACYYKVKSRYKVWPSAYASGALVKCRKKGAKNWGTKSEGIEEATKLAAPTRPIGDPELTDYLDRIRGQEKKKTDKYKLPYIHRSSVVGYYNEEGKKYNVDAIKKALAERPKALLKKNEKMKHSDGEQEQFFNIGFAALVGIALDENTNELIVVNTCPGAGSCKIDCFAMKGGKVQFQGPWLSDGKILTYLLNDPNGFFEQLKAEISKEVMKGKKGGYKVSIRWHDAGDFFSPEYAAMAFKLASELPDVDFYAYTKVADVALGNKPKNFMINWSEGASSSQEKKVKGADPSLEKTKNSRIVPSNLFYDLLVKDEKKNLVKGPEGQWQVIPDKLPELKSRLAKEYGLSPNSILSYSEWESKVKGKDRSPLKYNVIITPGEPDLTAKDAGVLSTLLLKH